MTPIASLKAEKVKVWDIFVRLFHWSLVLCIVLNFFVLKDEETLHQVVGYVASSLVVLRVVWGFIGSRYARFADFFPTPSRLQRHVSALKEGRHPQYIGHNPLGALMIFGLMATVVGLGVTGWLQGTDAFFGEEWLQELHEALAYVLVIAAGMHALAAGVMGKLERVNLIKAMFTGSKEFR